MVDVAHLVLDVRIERDDDGECDEGDERGYEGYDGGDKGDGDV